MTRRRIEEEDGDIDSSRGEDEEAAAMKSPLLTAWLLPPNDSMRSKEVEEERGLGSLWNIA
jgi:hypothetical protein